MGYSCKILLDSISETNKRITTFEVTFPRCVLAEAETHRVLRGFGGNVEELIIHDLGINVHEDLSRNSASSRAIPINKMLQQVKDDPFIPEKWGKPIGGMGAKEYWPIDSIEHLNLTMNWTIGLNNALGSVEAAMDFGNKEDLNRLLEPFMYHTAIITATEFDNFFKLRTHSAADWKIRKIADLMYEAYHAWDDFIDPTANMDIHDAKLQGIINENWTVIKPQKLKVGEWHCPLVYEEDKKVIHDFMYDTNGSPDGDLKLQIKKKISVARCARVSYLTHDGKRDIEKDLELFERLRTSGHWSPFEHIATPYFSIGSYNIDKKGYSIPGSNKSDLRSGNFIGWKQFRKEFADENCTDFKKSN